MSGRVDPYTTLGVERTHRKRAKEIPNSKAHKRAVQTRHAKNEQTLTNIKPNTFRCSASRGYSSGTEQRSVFGEQRTKQLKEPKK